MTTEPRFQVVVTRVDDDTQRVIEVGLAQCDRSGWNEHVAGWSIGPAASGALIAVEEPKLATLGLGVFGAGRHVLLWGRRGANAPLPHFYRADGAGGWAPWELDAEPTHVVSLRFDRAPLRIGRHVIRFCDVAPHPGATT